WADQRFVTGHAANLLTGALGSNGTMIHGSHERVGGANAPQAHHEKQDFLLERDFVLAFGPADYALTAHHHVSGERPLPESPVDGACEPYELLGRDAFVARGAFQYRVLTDGSTLSREPRVGRPPPRIA